MSGSLRIGQPVFVIVRRAGRPLKTDIPQQVEAIIVKRNGNNVVVQSGDRRWRAHPKNILPRD